MVYYFVGQILILIDLHPKMYCAKPYKALTTVVKKWGFFLINQIKKCKNNFRSQKKYTEK